MKIETYFKIQSAKKKKKKKK